MATRKEYEMLFQLNAQLGSNYSGTFKTAQNAIISMQNEITALGKTQSDISAYQKQQVAVENSRKKLELLQQQYDNIQKEIQETGTYSSALENKLLQKQQQIDKASASLQSHTEKLNRMSSALQDAGINTADLSGESARLGNEIEDLKRKQEEAADKAQKFGAAASNAFISAGEALVATGLVKAMEELKDSFEVVAEASMIFESGMISVDKTTDLTADEFAKMSEEIKELSTEIPILTGELTDMGETAGQLGILKENLMDFSEVMAMLSTATTMTPQYGATMLAQFATITQMDPRFYGNLASSLVDLGNHYATTEQKIIDMSQGIAASASLAKMSEADMLGLSAAVTALGIETQAGSSSMNKLISRLMTAVETGEDLTNIASIANMTAAEFKTAWGEDAVRALQAFIMGLNDAERNGKSAIVALSDLGLTEVRMQRMILSLANSGDLLNSTLDTSSRAWAENTALITEAEKRYASTQSQLIMKQSAYNNLKIAIGDNYTPVLKELYAAETDVLKTVTEFVEQNPELVKAVTAFVGVIGAATAGIAAYVAITKVAAVVSAALTSAIPGVNIIAGATLGIAALTAATVSWSASSKKQLDEMWELTAASRQQYIRLQELNAEYEEAAKLYGETSYEAQSLRWKIEDLSAEYEVGKQSLTEYKEVHESLMSSYREMATSHSEAYEEIETEREGISALISKLKELTSTSDGATINQQAILSIIEALNKQMPELALNYDDVVNSSSKFTDALDSIADTRAAQAKLEQQWDDYVDRVGRHDALKSAKEAAEYNAKIAQEEYDLARQAHKDAVEMYEYTLMGTWLYTREEQAAVDAAKEQLDLYNAAMEETGAAYKENAEAIAELEEALQGYQEAQEAAAAAGEEITEVLRTMTFEYKEAYNAAMESISGQYELWDEAAKVAEISASTINEALESQTTYWQNYTANIDSLSERSSDIVGLSEVIASFADGSEGSVNAIAGMAAATDEELQAMVENWQRLQEEQELTADSLARLQTEFETSVEDMNLSDEAAKSGEETIKGYIQGAEGMIPYLQSSFSDIARAGLAAMSIKGPGFAAVSAHFEDRGFGSINLTVSPHYEISGIGSSDEIKNTLRGHSVDIKDMVLEIIEDAKIDRARRAYT